MCRKFISGQHFGTVSDEDAMKAYLLQILNSAFLGKENKDKKKEFLWVIENLNDLNQYVIYLLIKY